MSEPASTAVFSADYTVSFGDCDPAGIVFYPNIFAWLDRTFHGFLREAGGGHGAICAALGLKGVGLVEAHCGFRSPLVDGNALTVTITDIDWGERGFRVAYSGDVGARPAFKGYEDRALFVEQDGRMRAGDARLLEHHLATAQTTHEHAG
ncbi:MAG: acyl-CoA thioesterase [Pseudomonadota bacterium]